ncbi:hypothetical protein [Streptomyces gilvus]|uniref:hypothetical protein n=1 Tax=Streptomyces gilvus TaxID=2920937 RepID=UPI001F0F4BC1|nr:hypothetical protein [Streptomyces sp. CME 23]MCH5677298.1 hypothetical protein [Streptomyces sp. CME 23]
MTWHMAALGRSLAAAAATAGLALGAAACSHGNQEQHRPAAASSPTGNALAPRAQLETGRPLAELQGQGGLSLTLTSAEKAPAGYVTVRGELKNNTSTVTVIPAELRGEELKVLRTGPSLAGATLTDFTHRKRYYVLRDTEGRPLTTTGLSTLRGGESARVFMQFPSPAARAVGFQLPLFETATIRIGE